MVGKRREKIKMTFGAINVKRCFCASVFSVAVFPVLLMLSALEPAFAAEYRIPFAFFSIGSAAFAYLLHQVAKNKIRHYYSAVTGIYLTAFQLFFICLASKNILFYYIAVIMTAYLVYLSVDHYILMSLGQLVGFAVLITKSGVSELALGQFLLIAGVHLFAFVFSRDLYSTKKNIIIEEKRLRQEMQAAEHDPMTGLLNRRGLERKVEEKWQTSLNRQETVAAFVIDIDLFKAYNDRFGHVQGDACIRQVAQCIKDTVHGYGIAARIGGEEFLVFVRGRSAQDINNLAEQIRENVESLHISRGTAGVITVSVGVDVRYATEDINLQGLYGRADRALYQAKQAGRNCVRSTQSMNVRRTKIG